MMKNSQNEFANRAAGTAAAGTSAAATLARDCREARAKLADLLLDPEAAPEAVRAHMESCVECAAELAAFEATMDAMDAWTVPETTPFFDTRLYARLREEQQAQPEGWLERLRSFVLFSTGRHLRPAMAGALGLVLMAGGAGSFVGLHHPAPQSATVNDLRILDNNAQALQQMDQLLDDNADDDPPPAS